MLLKGFQVDLNQRVPDPCEVDPDPNFEKIQNQTAKKESRIRSSKNNPDSDPSLLRPIKFTLNFILPIY